jgi:hypothetical protein
MAVVSGVEAAGRIALGEGLIGPEARCRPGVLGDGVFVGSGLHGLATHIACVQKRTIPLAPRCAMTHS